LIDSQHIVIHPGRKVGCQACREGSAVYVPSVLSHMFQVCSFN